MYVYFDQKYQCFISWLDLTGSEECWRVLLITRLLIIGDYPIYDLHSIVY